MGWHARHHLSDREASKGRESQPSSAALFQQQLWASEQHRMIKFMSEEDQRAIAEAEAKDDFSSEAYARRMNTSCSCIVPVR